MNITILPLCVSVLCSPGSMSTSCRGPTPLSFADEMSWSEQDSSVPPCPPCCPLAREMSWLLSIELCLFMLSKLLGPELLCSEPPKSLCLLCVVRAEGGKEPSEQTEMIGNVTESDTDHNPCQTASSPAACSPPSASPPQPSRTPSPVFPACTPRHLTCAEAEQTGLVKSVL